MALLVVAGLVMSEVGTWRYVFMFYGVLGIVWAVLFMVWYRDSPAEHPHCNLAEQALIQAGRPATDTVLQQTPEPVPWANLFRTRNMLCLCGANILVNAGWIFLVTLLPTYLKDVYGLELKSIGWLTAATGLAGVIGCFSGGLLTDILVRKLGLLWGRRLPALTAGTACAICYALCLLINDPYVLIAVLACTYFLTDLSLGALWATYQDVGGPHVGSILGFNNMAGNLSAAIFTSIIGRLAEHHMWHWVFIFSSASFVLTVICWSMVDPRIPFDTKKPSPLVLDPSN
jgi:MFS transporter, ACS family, glucarate transporter